VVETKFKVLSRNLTGRSEKNYENLNQDSPSPGPHEYEAGIYLFKILDEERKDMELCFCFN
jgi:hypothetical protein